MTEFLFRCHQMLVHNLMDHPVMHKFCRTNLAAGEGIAATHAATRTTMTASAKAGAGTASRYPKSSLESQTTRVANNVARVIVTAFVSNTKTRTATTRSSVAA